MDANNFILITLAKNEEKFLPLCINAVVNSDLLPKLWILVNDGSTDKTLKIMQENSEKYDFIKYITINNKNITLLNGRYSFLCNSGFNYAINHCQKNHISWKYIGSLDADTIVTKQYFSKLINNMNNEEKMGIASGSLYDKFPEGYILINTIEDLPRGTGRLIRQECFKEIKGYQGSSPDSVSNIKAKLLGWKTKNYNNIYAYHLRPSSTKGDKHILNISRGAFFYSLNIHPILFLLQILQRAAKKEGYLFIWIIKGYIISKLKKMPKTDDKIVQYYYYHIKIREIIKRLI